MAKISFNQYIATDSGPLGQVWQSRRGRLTRASVETRASREYGLPEGTGAKAWDAYLAFIANPNPESTQ
jgi:hypothetical protein